MPEAREKAKKQLTKLARNGDRAALDTLKKTPVQWARDYAGKKKTVAK